MVYEVNAKGFVKLFSLRIFSSMRKQLKMDFINLKSILEA
jgi:hypothetical protein